MNESARWHRVRGPRAQVLYFVGCPNYGRAQELVRQTAAELGLNGEIELIEVEDEDRAVVLRFLGSPTVRVEGHDVEPGADDREDYAFACRLYRSRGAVRDLPDPIWIREALAAAATR